MSDAAESPASARNRSHDLHVRVAPETKARLVQVAAQEQRSLAAQVECALAEWLAARAP